FAAFYTGRDIFKFGDDFGFGWGNMTGTFRWNHLFNEKLFSNVSVIGSQFDYKLEYQDNIEGFKWTSSLKEFSIKADLSYAINTRNELSFGYHVTGRQFSPGKIAPNSTASIFETLEQQQLYALDHGLYISNQQQFSDRLTVDYGVRLSIFQNVGSGDVYRYTDPQDKVELERTDTLHYSRFETIKAYINVEPRLGIRYTLAAGQAVKLSYNRMVQNTHLVSAATVPIPFNTWTPSNFYLKPQIADQYAIGYFRNFRDNMFEFSIEGYYKDIQHVTDFVDNADIFFNEDLTTEYRQGKAWSYGTELMLNKKQGRVTGMLSYTLSKTMREIPDVNGGKAFRANTDRRNALNIQAAYDHNEKWTFGATFTYSTGRPITITSGKYEYGTYQPDVITGRNGYLLPSFHRLDLSATLTPRKPIFRKWKGQGQWIFSIYNVYNRKNPFTIYTRTKQDKDGNIIGDGTEKEARLIYLFPIMPSVTYNFKF
ncbi:MAG TPA: TonB-dependent receptor, partial [Ohtaekwangia sp.]|nr:TonB-dependent receptor [Ohtaekwangia sp.]